MEQVEPESFWTGRKACWEVRCCIPEAKDVCAAYANHTRPCWEQDTLCKQILGRSTCFSCEVARMYNPSMCEGYQGKTEG